MQSPPNPKCRVIRRLAVLMGCGAILSLSAALALPAFPGAEGWGAETVGGRGGDVLVVTSLGDDGSPGTLRWAVEQPYPRIIVFRVGGVIELERPLTIGGERGRAVPSGGNPYSYVTVAGQSAPGGGITLTGYPLSLVGDVHDVVVRHLRIRNTRVDRRLGSIGDGIELAGAHDVVLDHVSVSWVADEAISIESTSHRVNHDVTVQYSLLAEGLLNGGHPSGRPHSRCMIASDGSFRISLHHNLMISCNRRNPSVAGNSDLGAADEPLTDVRHNIAYNFGERGLQFGRGALSNIVGNLLRFGPDSAAALPMTSLDRRPAGTRIHLDGNCVVEHDDNGTPVCPSDQTELIVPVAGTAPELEPAPFEAPRVSEPRDLESELLAAAGALPRDAADEKFIDDYRSFRGDLGAGGLGQDEIEVPAPADGTAPPDEDLDGMPDDWEVARGLDPRDPADAVGDRDGDGYANVEEYLNGLGGQAVLQPTAPSKLRARASSSTAVSLSWRDGSDDELSFEIESRPRREPFEPVASVAADVTSLVVSGLQPDTRYTFRARALNSVGASDYSNRARATTPPEGGSGEAPVAGDGIHYAVQFERSEESGSVASYAGHPSGLPRPGAVLAYGNVVRWHGDPGGQARLLRDHAAEAAAHGTTGLVYTPTAPYRGRLERAFLAGQVPPLDELVRRPWVSRRRPGFLAELEAQRDVIRELVDRGIVDHIVLRPFQEAGHGMHSNAGLTPERYADLIGWMVNELYDGLPVAAVIVHWNRIEGLERAIPDLADRRIDIYAGLTANMPSHGGMASIAMSRHAPALAGRDFATRAWETAGVETWIAELSILDDGRRDPVTGWSAGGLGDASSVPGFFQHYRNLRETGHLGGITWLNKAGTTRRDGSVPDLKDGRWDAEHVDPDVRNWWIDEVSAENGYRLE